MWVDFDVRGQQKMDFFTGGSVIMDYVLIFNSEVMFKVKNALMMDLIITNMKILMSQDVNWWTGVTLWIIVMF